MDINAIIAGLQNVVALVIAWVTAHLQSQEQWMIFLAGLALIAIGAYSAWRARRMGPYKLSVFMVKLGFGLLMLAIGWNNAQEIYERAVSAFGNPLAGLAFVFAAGMFGYEIISRLLPKKQTT